MSKTPLSRNPHFRQQDPAAVHQKLKADLQELKRRSFTPYYQAAFGLARELENILNAAHQFLLPQAPDLAWDLADTLLKSDRVLLYKVDDSSGAVGGTLDLVPKLWLDAARKMGKDSAFWRKELKRLLKKDEWGFRGAVLENMVDLVGRAGMEKLAWHYKKAALKEKERTGDTDDHERKEALYHNTRMLEHCARALKDPVLYEEAVRLGFNGQLYGSMRLEAAEQYLQAGDIAGAKRILAGPMDKNFEKEELTLLARVYKAAGDKHSQINMRRKMFKLLPDEDNYLKLKALLPEKEQADLEKEAVTGARQDPDIFRGVRLLLALKKDKEAETLLINKQDKMEYPYPDAYNLLPDLDKRGLKPGMAVCFRVLLLEILARAKSKNYRIAAKHFKALAALDKEITKYPPGMAGHKEFVEALEQMHGRKPAFWKLVGKNI